MYTVPAACSIRKVCVTNSQAREKSGLATGGSGVNKKGEFPRAGETQLPEVHAGRGGRENPRKATSIDQLRRLDILSPLFF
jgi:hypothetical protein